MKVNRALFEKLIYESGSTLEVVLRGHLFLEAMVNELLELEMTDPKVVGLERLGFRQKVDIAQAFALINPADGEALRALNRLRNHVAHHLDSTPAEPEVRELERFLKGRTRAAFDAGLETWSHAQPDTLNKPIARLSFWLTCYAMNLSYTVAIRKYRKENEIALIKYEAVMIVHEDYLKTPISTEEVRRQVGLPDPPEPSSFWPRSSSVTPPESFTARDQSS